MGASARPLSPEEFDEQRKRRPLSPEQFAVRPDKTHVAVKGPRQIPTIGPQSPRTSIQPTKKTKTLDPRELEVGGGLGVEGYDLPDMGYDVLHSRGAFASNRPVGAILDIANVPGAARSIVAGKELVEEGHPLIGAGVAAAGSLPFLGPSARKVGKKVAGEITEQAAKKVLSPEEFQKRATESLTDALPDQPGIKGAATREGYVERDALSVDWTIMPRNPWVVRLPDGRGLKRFESNEKAQAWLSRQPKSVNIEKNLPSHMKARPGFLDLRPNRRQAPGDPYLAPTDAGKDPRMVNMRKMGLSPEGEQEFRAIVGEHGTKEVVSHEATAALAAELAMDPVSLMKRAGDLSGAEALAMRDVIAQNSERIAQLSKAAIDPTAQPAAREAAEAEIDRLTHDVGEMANRFTIERSKAGRDLNAYKIIARHTMEPSVWLTQAQRIKASPLNSDEITDLLRLTSGNDRAGLIAYISKLHTSSPWEKAITLWKAGLLTGTGTHIINPASNLVNAVGENVKEIPATAIDAIVSALRGTERTKSFSLQAVLAQGKGFKKGLGESLATMKGELAPEVLEKWDFRRVNYDNPVAQGYVDGVFNLLQAEDRPFFQAAALRSTVERARLLAKREGLKGEAFKTRVNSLVADPPQDLKLAANADGMVATFQNPNRVAKGISKLKAELTPKGKAGAEFAAPFVRTPTNIGARFYEWSPLGVTNVFKLFAKELPAVEQKRLVEALGRTATGGSLALLGATLYASGRATGSYPKDTGEAELWRMQGKTPNSVLVGGKWYPVSRFGPQGLVISLGAQWAEGAENSETLGGKVLAGAGAFTRTMLDQTFLKGASSILATADNPESKLERFADQTIGSVVPSIVGQVARGTDRTERDTRGASTGPVPTGNLKARLPVVSRSLPARPDAFGRDVKREGGLGTELLGPLAGKTASTDPLLREMERLGVTPATVGKTRTVRGERVSRDASQRRDFTRTAGPVAQRFMRETIASAEYKRADDNRKREMLERRIDAAQQYARNQEQKRDRLAQTVPR